MTRVEDNSQCNCVKGNSIESDSGEIPWKNFGSHTMHFMYSCISHTWLFGQYFGPKKCDLYSNKYGTSLKLQQMCLYWRLVLKHSAGNWQVLERVLNQDLCYQYTSWSGGWSSANHYNISLVCTNGVFLLHWFVSQARLSMLQSA